MGVPDNLSTVFRSAPRKTWVSFGELNAFTFIRRDTVRFKLLLRPHRLLCPLVVLYLALASS